MLYQNHVVPKHLLFTLLLSIGVLFPVASYSKGEVAPNSATRSLKGLKAFRVIAEDLSLTMQQTGLRKEQLEGTVVEALRKSGLTVLSNQDAGKVPLVYVRLSSVFADEAGTGPIGFYVTLQIKQPATLLSEGLAPPQPHTQESPLLVTTWEGGTMAMVNREELFFYIKQTLLNLVGDLTQDYQAANLKQVGRSQ